MIPNYLNLDTYKRACDIPYDTLLGRSVIVHLTDKQKLQENHWPMIPYIGRIGVITNVDAIPVKVEFPEGDWEYLWRSVLILPIRECGGCEGPIFEDDYLCRDCRSSP